MRSPNHLEVKRLCREYIAPLMEKHQLGSPRQIVVDDAGWVNPCIFVDDSIVFHFNARDSHLPKYQREKIAFHLLKDAGVPVPHQVILDDSKTIAPFDVLITERLPGRNLETDWSILKTTQREALAMKAGRLLTRISSVPI